MTSVYKRFGLILLQLQDLGSLACSACWAVEGGRSTVSVLKRYR